ncbi:MAG: EamA/RhaT family transporter, partial [Nitrospira sp.]|nr:EamA/RhaT family transporter [Nitrospira sp.]
MANLWIALAFLSAFTLATSDALTKKALAYSNEYLTALFRLLFSLPFLLVLWIFIPAPKLNSDFYKAFAFALPLEIIALVWYIKALRISP